MRETEYSAKILHELRTTHRAVAFSISGNIYQASGYPDCFIAHEKFVGFIEFKGKDTIVRKLQKHHIKLLKSKGVNVFVVRFLILEVKPYAWRIENEKGEDIANVLFHTFAEGVSKLLDTLHELTSPKKSEHPGD